MKKRARDAGSGKFAASSSKRRPARPRSTPVEENPRSPERDVNVSSQPVRPASEAVEVSPAASKRKAGRLKNDEEKIQSLRKIVAILGDPAKRELYDETGSTEDAVLSSETVKILYEFFRPFYKKIIVDGAASNQGSESEQQELKDLYTKHKGHMHRVFEQLMSYNPQQDSHRFMSIINDAISTGELQEYDVYKTWAKKEAEKLRPSEPVKRAKCQRPCK